MVVPTHPKDGTGDAGGTKQGRIIAKSAAQPQTWPPLIKSAVRSRFPGGTVLAKDAAQIEPRVAALLSGDVGMIRVFQEGKVDFHTDTTVRLFGPSVTQNPYFKSGDIAKDPRQWGKVGGLLLLYRGGWERLQRSVLSDAGVLLPTKLCQDIAYGMPKVRPGLVAWQDELIRTARRQGYLEVWFVGQSRTFLNTGRDRGEDWDENEIVNFPVQTTAGNTLLQVQAQLHRLLPPLTDPDPPILMVNNIYDSVWLDCKPGYETEDSHLFDLAAQHVATQGYWAMLQDRTGNQVPLEWDSKEL